jgi:SAM-dependent methyltransferase
MMEAPARSRVGKLLETAMGRLFPLRRPIRKSLRNFEVLAGRIAALENHLSIVESHYGTAFWLALDAAYDISLPHRDIKCIVCEHTDKRAGYEILTDNCIFGGGKLERYRCPSCDCIFGAQKYLDLDESFVNVDYQLLYARYSEGDTTSNEIRTFHSMLPMEDRTYLDWGCGADGKALARIREEGFSVLGFEPSIPASTARILKRREEISTQFDGIFSNNVIEHFRSPVSLFKDFHSLLKEGGVMAHSSACYEYAYPFTRFHTLFLLGRSPHILAERSGFKVKNIVKDNEYISYLYSKAS